ncbi:MAG: DUF4422 domain-containing protein [Blautia sp.]|nr:DUF4422 domain-containing protein [Blautia sp.]
MNYTCKSPYRLIAVGDKRNVTGMPECVGDHTGTNIAGKNKNYCELTALYWIWKNDKASDIVGLCHYRRFLTKNLFRNSMKDILDERDIQRIFRRGYDIILPYKPIARRTVEEIYCDFGFKKDLNLLREILLEKYPEYLSEYDRLLKRHSNYVANLMILSEAKLNQYAEWLFDILFEMEKRNDISSYNEQEARIYGYLSERLLDVWVRKNHLKIKHFRMMNIEEEQTVRKFLLDCGSVVTTWMKNY